MVNCLAEKNWRNPRIVLHTQFLLGLYRNFQSVVYFSGYLLLRWKCNKQRQPHAARLHLQGTQIMGSHQRRELAKARTQYMSQLSQSPMAQ